MAVTFKHTANHSMMVKFYQNLVSRLPPPGNTSKLHFMIYNLQVGCSCSYPTT